jgi:hypothetical protein
LINLSVSALFTLLSKLAGPKEHLGRFFKFGYEVQ